MEVKLDKRYPVAATLDQAWAVLADIHAVARCMPGAQITEQLDATHYKGTVKSKVGPAVMQFGGDIEVLAMDAAARSMQMLGKGADKSGSSAAMNLSAVLEAGDDAASCVLVGQATVTVSGKLAQFGSRLLVPVSDAMLAQFANNFRAAAAAGPVAAEAAPPVADLPPQTVATGSAAAPAATAAVAAPTRVAAPQAPAPVKELNALALMWTVLKGWLAGLFGKRP
jgi:carbon monoxide dehydrogenase subunit G